MTDSGTAAAILRAAAAGAKSITRSARIRADACTLALERWEDAVLRHKPVRDWNHWAFRVGANAARGLSKRTPHAPHGLDEKYALATSSPEQPETTGDDTPSDSRKDLNAKRQVLRAHLAKKKHLLRGRQWQVLEIMAQPGMTFHQAARALAMPRFNLRRAFRSGLRRLVTRT